MAVLAALTGTAAADNAVKPSERSVGLLNPLADTGAFLRERLLPGLVAHVERNWNNQTRDVRLFEVGTVFERGAPGARPIERTRAAAVITGGREPAHWTNPDAPDLDRWDGKGLAEAVAALAYPGTSWHVHGDAFEARDRDGRPVGWAGPLQADAPPWAAPLFGVEIDSFPRISIPSIPRGNVQPVQPLQSQP